ncbi:MAG TPA: PHB depolymerase family esterase [Mycobacteriales bacterium]|nr:PHB depolymerase family esterase [Mycobacteriales bacterium]
MRPLRILAAAAATAVAAAALAAVASAPPAAAAGFAQVGNFGSNPGNLAMYEYVPPALSPSPAVVVAMHGCTQTATAYYQNSGWPKYADRHGFVVVFPEQRTANNSNRCFNWFQPGDATRDQGEALSIRQMVGSAVSRHGGGRVFVTGLSAGGAMTAVLLAQYPDLFAGGSVVAGLPAGCATDVASAFTCMNPGVDRTPAQWAQAVRAGGRPRVAIWHGTSDTTVVPRNADELRDQWTAVHGISTTPTSTGSLPGPTRRETYGSGQVQVYRVQGMGHGTPVDPGGATDQCGATAAYFLDFVCSSYHTAVFWGLTGGSTPTPTATPTSTPPAGATCHEGSNYEHVQAGRATTRYGYVYAVGSGQAMGLYNTWVRHTLRQSPPGYYTVADAGCP